MKNFRVNTLINGVVEKLNNNQMSSLRGGSTKRIPIDHIGPVNKSTYRDKDKDKDKDNSDSNNFISKFDVFKGC